MSTGLTGYTFRRAALAGLAFVAFVAGVVSALAVVEGQVDPGFAPDVQGNHVGSIVPSGPAWRIGVRVGQSVVLSRPADDPAGWRIETSDGQTVFVVDSASENAGLAATAPLAGGAFAAGALALVLLRLRRQWVLPVATIALVLAQAPLDASGNITSSTAVLVGALAVPGAWAIWRWLSARLARFVVAISLAGFVCLWVSVHVSGLQSDAVLEPWAQGLAVVGAAGLFLDRALAYRLGERVILARPRPFDVAAFAVITGAAVTLVNLLALPALPIVMVAVVALLTIPRLRRRLRPLENVLLADVRAQAAAEAAERERGRLARELHDVPLQELFGVIRRLEVKPGTEAESDDLRALASHLRNVAIDLRPPVLDDLGLAAALEYLAEGATTPDLPVRAQISDRTGLGRELRPPEEVELAFYRIAMEAVTNAVTHAAATEVVIAAAIEPRRVDVQISDDGIGLDVETVRSAARQKHMGLTSMRRRADAVDADFSIKSTSAGTTIQMVWQE